MSATQELADAVRRRAQGTPYVVEETPEGFDVRTDEATRSCTVEHELRTLTWRDGTDGRERPELGAMLGVTRGRVRSTNVQKTFTVGLDGVRQTSERRVDPGAGRRLVEDAVKELGWTQRLSLDEKIGLSVAVVTVALLVLGGIVVGVVALAGGFS